MRTTATRWRGARIIGAALKVLAWIILILGIAVIIFVLVRGGIGVGPRAVFHGGGPGGGPMRVARVRGLGTAAAIARFLAVIVAFLLLYGAGVTLQMLATIADNTQPGAPGAVAAPRAPYPPAPPSSVTPGPSQLPPTGADDPTYPPR